MVRNQVFNVGSNDQNFMIKDIARLIHQQVPSARLVNMEEVADPRNYWVDFQRIDHVLSFKPEWTVERGITQVIEALLSGRIGNYRDARYSNIEFLKQEGIYLLTNNESSWALDLLNGGSQTVLIPDEA